MPEHFCNKHNVPFEPHSGKYGSFWSHKLPDGKYCNESKDAAPKDNPEIEPAPKPVSNQNRSYALSYAKDVAVARINKGEDIKAIAIIQVAELFRKWLDGDIDIEGK